MGRGRENELAREACRNTRKKREQEEENKEEEEYYSREAHGKE